MDADWLGHDYLAKMLSPARTPDAPDENPEAKPPRKYAVENDRRLSGQGATISIIGGNPIVGRALEILLAGVGYDARLAGDFENGNRSLALDGARLLLLAPTLDGASPGTEEITALATLAKLPVLALVSAASEHPQAEDGAYYVPWPCRTAELAREIEAALSRPHLA